MTRDTFEKAERLVNRINQLKQQCRDLNKAADSRLKATRDAGPIGERVFEQFEILGVLVHLPCGYIEDLAEDVIGKGEELITDLESELDRL
jgi:hypothetical protein